MKSRFAFFLLGVTLCAGCAKSDDQLEITLPSANTLAEFTKHNAVPVQVFTFDPTQATTLTTAAKASFEFAQNAFVMPNGQLPLGQIEVRIQEIYSPADMVLSNMPTMTDRHQPLESGGEFNVRACSGTTPLKLRNATGLNVISPVPARVSASGRNRMVMWTRTGTNPDSMLWRSSRDSVAVGISSPNNNEYVFNAPFWPDTLGWLNYDCLPASPAPRIRVSIDLGGSYLNTRVYLIPQDLNGALRPYWDPQAQLAIQSYLPDGMMFTAVVLREREGSCGLVPKRRRRTKISRTRRCCSSSPKKKSCG